MYEQTREPRQPIGMTAMTESWNAASVIVDGTRLHYYRTARPGTEKPTLLLLHGVTDDGLCWTRVALDLEAGFHVIMPDARGHGLSARVTTAPSIPRLAADVAGILDALALESVVVFGHSMGAITGATLAAARPDLVRALILEDPPLGPHTTPPDFEAWRAYLASWRELTYEERLIRAAQVNPQWDALENEPWANSKAAVDPAVIEIARTATRDWEAVFRGIRCPGLLITADPARGAIVPPDAAAKAIALWPDGRLVHIDGAGHSIHRDRWDETMAAVRAFVKTEAAE